MRNAKMDFNMPAILTILTESITGIPEMRVIKSPIPAKPCHFDFTETYCKRYGCAGIAKDQGKRNEGALKVLRKLPTPGKTDRKTLTVTVNDYAMVFTIGNGNEYFNTLHDGTPGKQSLSDYLQALASGKGNKIQIA